MGKRVKETNINENNTKSECYPTVIKTKRRIRRSRKTRNLLATNPRINGSFTSSTSSSWASSSDSSDSEAEPLSIRNSLDYSSNSDYELSAANLEHESDSEFYKNPYIDSDGDIYYGDARPNEWDLEEPIKDMEKDENNENDTTPGKQSKNGQKPGHRKSQHFFQGKG